MEELKKPPSPSVVVCVDMMLRSLVDEEMDRLIAMSRSDKPVGRRALLTVLLRPLDGAVWGRKEKPGCEKSNEQKGDMQGNLLGLWWRWGGGDTEPELLSRLAAPADALLVELERLMMPERAEAGGGREAEIPPMPGLLPSGRDPMIPEDLGEVPGMEIPRDLPEALVGVEFCDVVVEPL